MISLFEKIVGTYSKHVALAVKRAGEWKSWTYEMYFKEAQVIAKAFIKVRVMEDVFDFGLAHQSQFLEEYNPALDHVSL